MIIPPASVLDPTDTAAVVGGNVLTSQRIVDVVLKAFEVCAASQVSEKSRDMRVLMFWSTVLRHLHRNVSHT